MYIIVHPGWQRVVKMPKQSELAVGNFWHGKGLDG